MQDLEELLAQIADARKIYGKEPVAPYHSGNRVLGSKHGYPNQDAAENARDQGPAPAQYYHGTARDLLPSR